MLKVKCSVYHTAYPTFSLQTEVVDYRYTPIKSGDIIHSTSDAKFEYFITSTSEDGLYHYGARQLVASYDNPAGYVWSSRCSVMNKLFGTRLVEVFVNGGCYGMDVDLLKELVDRDLEDNFEVVQNTDDRGEISYRFIKHEK